MLPQFIPKSPASLLLLFFIASLSLLSCNRKTPAVLIFSKTEGFTHDAIPDGIEAIMKLGQEHGFDVDTTTNAALFTEEHLQNYSAIIFLNTTGNVLNPQQETEMQRYIQSGGGFVGVHAAADTEYHWGWYGRLVGGYFLDHPGINDPHPNVQPGTILVADPNHPSTEFLPERWERTDEWYSYRDIYEEVNVLLKLDEQSYQGGAEMGDHPVAWYHEFDGGRSFYTGLGHTKESYSDELFLQHLLAGIEYAIGSSHRPDYSASRTSPLPEENRFTKTQLILGELFEPTEMTILPNLDILIAQRRGEILLYKNADSTLSEVGLLDVYWYTEEEGVNAEEGVIGIQADPDFENNNFVYIFYTPADTSVNRISRFEFRNDLLQMDSETLVLEFYSQRDICCHTGGSLAFDNNGLLYASTGDNSTPFNQPTGDYTLSGYAPLDGRPGFEQYDARRTSGNSNDLRGKILRLNVQEDGSYTIPEGNLYPEGMPGTRPEIYVQGTRNPYRISIDPMNNYLYWGDVGPDASNDSLETRGPKGYDEINQTREAGHYGWPYLIGDNYPYREFDFNSGTPGEAFDPDAPVNRSPSNTGIEVLPPSEPAFIWYPYDASPEFPLTRTGGRNAMAGPVYYTELFPEETRLPDYYDGKFFIYDWIRDWIRVVSMHEDGSFDKMEPFMESTTFNGVIDMEVGPDGRLYLLEYGKGWFTQNRDSGIARIDYNAGNRSPSVHALYAEEASGLLPFEAVFHVDATDPEEDPLHFNWHLSNGETVETTVPVLEYTFSETGEYSVRVKAVDPSGLSAMSEELYIYAGNVAPVLEIEIDGNQTFYFDDTPVNYSVHIEDVKRDVTPAEINPENLFVSSEFVSGRAAAEPEAGHQIITDAMIGRNLAATLDCRACHSEALRSVGPSYMEVSELYQDEPNAESYLMDQIITGSVGVWGDVAMPAHLDLPEEDARKIVAWILSLTDESDAGSSLPATGQITPAALDGASDQTNRFVLSARYTNETEPGITPLTGYASKVLRGNVLEASDARELDGFQIMEFGGQNLLLSADGRGSFSLGEIDLIGISSIRIQAGSMEPIANRYVYELRLNSPDGPVAGRGELTPEMVVHHGEIPAYSIEVRLDPADSTTSDRDIGSIYITSRPAGESGEDVVALTTFEFVPI